MSVDFNAPEGARTPEGDVFAPTPVWARDSKKRRGRAAARSMRSTDASMDPAAADAGAGMMAGDTTQPGDAAYTTTTRSAPANRGGVGLGAVAAGVVALAAIGGVAWYASQPHDNGMTQLTPGSTATSQTALNTATPPTAAQLPPADATAAAPATAPAAATTTTQRTTTTTTHAHETVATPAHHAAAVASRAPAPRVRPAPSSSASDTGVNASATAPMVTTPSPAPSAAPSTTMGTGSTSTSPMTVNPTPAPSGAAGDMNTAPSTPAPTTTAPSNTMSSPSGAGTTSSTTTP